jgi:hypothetical protein
LKFYLRLTASMAAALQKAFPHKKNKKNTQ